MNKIIEISVNEKIATLTNDTKYVCANSDFVVNFTFDSEWDAIEEKTARFSHSGSHTDVQFTGNQCSVPVIAGVNKMSVGVYGGDLISTTPVTVECVKSILCGAGDTAPKAITGVGYYTPAVTSVDENTIKFTYTASDERMETLEAQTFVLPKGEKGDKGENGSDYVLTNSDKSEIANNVKAMLKTENWTFTLEDGSSVTKAVYVV